MLLRVDNGSWRRQRMAKYGLLWLLGIPLPILIIMYLFFH
jgi:hypothetical protein